MDTLISLKTIDKVVSDSPFRISALPGTLLVCGGGFTRLKRKENSYDFQKGDIFISDNCEDITIIPSKAKAEISILRFESSILSSYLNSIAVNHPITIQSSSALALLISEICRDYSEASEYLMHSKKADIKISAKAHTLFSYYILEFMEDENESVSVPSYVRKIQKLFDEAPEEQYSLEELESRFGISRFKICREFSKYLNASPLQYLLQRRIEKACRLLSGTDMKIHEIGSTIGIENTNHFILQFKKHLNCTPLEYRSSIRL